MTVSETLRLCTRRLSDGCCHLLSSNSDALGLSSGGLPTGQPAALEASSRCALITGLCFFIYFRKSYEILLLWNLTCVVDHLACSAAQALRLGQTTFGPRARGPCGVRSLRPLAGRIKKCLQSGQLITVGLWGTW